MTAHQRGTLLLADVLRYCTETAVVLVHTALANVASQHEALDSKPCRQIRSAHLQLVLLLRKSFSAPCLPVSPIYCFIMHLCFYGLHIALSRALQRFFAWRQLPTELFICCEHAAHLRAFTTIMLLWHCRMQQPFCSSSRETCTGATAKHQMTCTILCRRNTEALGSAAWG